MAEVDGATLMARSLKQQGVDYMFGIVGFPVGPIADGRAEGGHHLHRHAQRAGGVVCRAGRRLPDRAPAARASSCRGPGVDPRPLRPRQRPAELLADDPDRRRHRRPTRTAWARSRRSARCWPRRRSPSSAHAIEHVDRIPFYVEQAVRHVDLRPARRDLSRHARRHHHRHRSTRTRCDEAATMPGPAAHARRCRRTSSARSTRSQSAERPLVIVGKGMAWSRAEDEVRAFIETHPAAVPRLADGQGRDARRPSAVGRRGAQPRAAEGRRRRS